MNRNPCVRNGPYRNGAPRPTKMGNIRSPWPYDFVRDTALSCPIPRLLLRLHFDETGLTPPRERDRIPNRASHDVWPACFD
jgi:hypothetical protein